jgi:aminopeptidase N
MQYYVPRKPFNTTGMKKFIPLLLLTFFCCTVVAQDKTMCYYQDPAANPPDLVITLKNVKADVRFKPEENLVIATADLSFFPNRYTSDSIVFIAPDFTISNLRLLGKDVDYVFPASQWKQKNNQLILYPPAGLLQRQQKYDLVIDYTAKPMAGAIYFTGWRPEEKGKRKEIWAHRPNGWLPCMDARVTMDMTFTFDKAFRVFANGECVEVKDNPDGTRTWHYKLQQDHPYYSTCVVIGEYDFEPAKSGNGVPLEYWYYRGEKDKVGTTYQYTPAMMDFFEKELGVKYPYPLYRQAPVVDYMYGAMETTTATVFGDFMLIDPHAFWQRNYINTNAHEMAHQWFGNCITQLENKDVWLTESFATYYAKLFDRSVFGNDYYENDRNDELNLALNAAALNNYPVGCSLGGVARIYQKGSLVLGMLRDVVGDREFREAVNVYINRWKFGYSESSDLLRCFYDVTGKPVNWFFDEWIFHGGEPNYKVSYTVCDDTTGIRSTVIHLSQIQETSDLVGLFRMPVNMEVHYKDGTKDSLTSWIEKQYHEISIPNRQKKPVAFVLFDPGRRIIKKISFSRTQEELASQATMASNMIDRYDALFAMRDITISGKKQLLLGRYHHEKFYLLKSEIIHQLAAERDDSCIALFRLALNDPDANVRKAVLKEITPLPLSLRADAERCLQDSSYLNIEFALQNLCVSYPDNKEDYLEQTKSLTGWRGLNIRMRWLEISINAGKKEYLPELIGYTGPSYEFETRMNALSALKKLRYSDAITIENARLAGKHWNNKLRDAGKEYLTYFGY